MDARQIVDVLMKDKAPADFLFGFLEWVSWFWNLGVSFGGSGFLGGTPKEGQGPSPRWPPPASVLLEGQDYRQILDLVVGLRFGGGFELWRQHLSKVNAFKLRSSGFVFEGVRLAKHLH